MSRYVADTLISLTQNAEKHSGLFNSTVAFPTPEYPGRTEFPVLSNLLRKKLEPATETLVEKGLESNSALAMEPEELAELWKWAGKWLGARLQNFIGEEFNTGYTAEEEEIGWENVRTGLRPEPEDDSEEDEDDSEDENGLPKQRKHHEPSTQTEKQQPNTSNNVGNILRLSSGANLAANFINSTQ